MRIITGSAKGTRLKTPKGLAVRPTGDRVKESVFNILAGRIEGSLVADLFAGTGNLGLEALSRGAKGAVFTDKSSSSINLAKENAEQTRLTDKCEFYKIDALAAVDMLGQRGCMFDLIFCDPPYNKGLVKQVLSKIDTNSILNDDGVVVIEHSKHELINYEFENLQVKRTERYGETLVSFIMQKDN